MRVAGERRVNRVLSAVRGVVDESGERDFLGEIDVIGAFKVEKAVEEGRGLR